MQVGVLFPFSGGAILFLAIVVLLVFQTVYFQRRPRKPLPPGPRRWPVLGNVLDIPREKEWLTFAKWGQTYGDVVSLSIFGRSIIILNSAKAAFDLLHKRSIIYSDRPHLTMGGELIGWDHALALTQYGERFRQMRRLMHQVFSSRSAQMFWPAEEQETARFLNRLLESPEKFVDNIRQTAGTIVLKISHGYTVSESGKDPLVSLAEKTLADFSLSTTPGAFMVDLMPCLKYVPSWFPGAGFRLKAAAWRKDLFQMAGVAHEFTKDQMARGKALPSFTAGHLEPPHTPEMESLIKWTAFSIYAGGTDTTVAAITTFFLAMCIYPEVQALAQAELDAVVGHERLPTMKDRSSLPYVNAVLKEVFRWGPVAPLPPHRLTHEDEYQGYRIPAGSIVVPNIWAMTRDPDIFPEPNTFRPDRFIGPNRVEGASADPLQLVFGFGRRICPGQQLAEPSLFLTIAMTLATFTITKAQDAQSGETIEPTVEWLPGTISHPKPFCCDIKPRFLGVVNLIKQTIGEDGG